MGTAYSKKLLVLYILDILQKYTDEEHRLSQKEILEILRKEYEMIVDRKTVRRNLLNLMEYDCEIECREVLRKKTDRSDSSYLGECEEEEAIWTDFYLKHKFTDEELRLLIDSVLFSRHIPYRQVKVSYNFYPRGRVEIKKCGSSIVYMNPNIAEEYVKQIMDDFGLYEYPKIIYDNSLHYKCYLDDGWRAE